MNKVNHRVFSGVQPSGNQVHLGNYLGAMKRFVDLSKQYPTTVCIVDLHALTSVEGPEQLEKFSTSLAAAYLAIGLDPKQTTIFRQSDVPEVCELMWYLACNFSLGLLERSHALKDAKSKNESVNTGIMFYPVLMAADILLNRANLVPVGADQKQHLEMTREVAIRFNNRYGEIFPVPEPLIEEDTGVIPGLDGRKMSKSYDNYIGLFENSKDLKKKVMRILTDSKSVEEVKDPDTCNVYKLYSFFANDSEKVELSRKYRAGGMGYGEAKLALLEVLERVLGPMRDSYDSWLKKPDEIRDILSKGATITRERSQETIEKVRMAMGIGKIL